jgi:hypothetical protein
MGCHPQAAQHTIVDPSEPVKLQQTLSSQYQGQPLILASLRGGGARLIHRLTPPPRTQITKTSMRASPPPS